ncbi:hypothetical protein, conserved [Trypanosoma brucei gambiense DAL972]|uniref:Uncharacterized protein n=2 Tax=Trypanosoma brucei TaxID=5691 RepID=C9ZV42_TRYB9|nr:hypothetical protein, conserved [Trypanosoma brucei gambiense DAL972]RHW70995.1 hypothetical protein DPX39_080028100 [Trypanosoma brucei equiperdum]CBH13280.1 hypothetical protein, conserved [Trypanosoma brucei gambiense DAL972]|eukprot:XP_011775557.1 hypothetical protein, conserved [Trypanosoma brucei gambiense DAL972]
MLGAVPPIVVLPSNPAYELRPVPVVSRSVGLYGPPQNETHGSDRGPGAGRSNVWRGDNVSVPPSNSTSRTNEVALHEGQEKRTSESGPLEAFPNNHSHCLDRVTDKEVDVLLDVLSARYQKYVGLKQRSTERYLARVESHVDRFLREKYRSGTSLFAGGVASFIKSKLPSPFHSPKPTFNSENGKDTHREFPTGSATDIHASSVSRSLPALEQCSYTPQCIPFNYLDVRPENMEAIAANLAVLQHCLAERVSQGSSGRKELLEPIIRDVWEKELDPLLREATELLRVAQCNVWPPLEYFLSRNVGRVSGERRLRYDCVVRGLRGDLHYLETIRKMEHLVIDGQSNGAGEESLDYVPVGGLALSRLYRLENEHRTVLEFWRSR